MRILSFIWLIAAIIASLSLSACIAPTEPPPQTPKPTVTTELTAQEIADRSVEAMREVKTTHFILEVENGTMVVAPGITVNRIEGDAVNPDRLRLTATAKVAGFSLGVEVIATENRQYVLNPLTRRWEVLQTPFPAANLFEPERGVANIMANVKNPVKLANEVVDGVETYHIKGKIASTVIAGIVGGAASGAEVDIDAWIGVDDFLVRRMKIKGPVLEGDSAEVIRTLHLSRFNEPISIEPPL
jgi:lipoprotein LprG